MDEGVTAYKFSKSFKKKSKIRRSEYILEPSYWLR
jgi:hypothetical protein